MNDYQSECWCEWVDIGVGMQRVTDNPECPEHGVDEDVAFLDHPGHALRQQFAALAPAVTETVRRMHRFTWLLMRPCECPTPTHRMSCGVSATPKVVTE